MVKYRKDTDEKESFGTSSAAWRTCSISKEALRPPVVACRLGRLYNKESIISYLLQRKSKRIRGLSHIKSLKDVFPVHLTPNPFQENDNRLKIQDDNIEELFPFICPISRKEMNGKIRFNFHTECGCVLSESAQKSVPSENCLNCGKIVQSSNIIPIHASGEEQAGLKASLNERPKKRLCAK